MNRLTSLQGLLIGLYAFFAPVNCAFSGELQKNSSFQQTAKLIGELLPARHVTGRPLDDEVSSRAFDRFIHQLDPSHSIFQPADKVEFEPYRSRLDDEMRKGSLRFPDLVYKRLRERSNDANTAITGKWSQSEEEQFTLFLNCVTQSFDPHTIYRASKSASSAPDKSQPSLQGIGAALAIDGGKVIVTSIVPGGAADKDGRLQEGDAIISIQQQNSNEAVVATGRELQEVVSMIRGDAGSTVILLIERDHKILDIQLVRAKIQFQEQFARGEVLERFCETNKKQYRIGFIDLPNFDGSESKGQKEDASFRSVSQDMKRLLENFASEFVDVVVVDVSSNYQGALVEAVNCAGLFIDRGPIVQVKDSKGELQTLSDEDAGASWEGPLVVLTSRESISASEVFAGAMRCYERALIVGDSQTHGKGTVQSILELGQQVVGSEQESDTGSLKITSKRYYFPDGTSNQKSGVPADILHSNPKQSHSPSEAELPFALPPDSIHTIPFPKYGYISEGLRTELKERMAVRNQSVDEEEVSQQASSKSNQQKGPFISSPYTEEVLRVAMDYLNCK